MRAHTGFSLIELAIVITIIGVLAAISLPKFASMTNMARTASVDGVRGALGGAVNIARSQWISQNQPPTIVMEGNHIIMSSGGWPEAMTGVANGTATPAKCLEVWEGIMQNPPSANTTCTGTCQYQVAVSVSPTCLYIDVQGTGANTVSYNISTGAVQ